MTAATTSTRQRPLLLAVLAALIAVAVAFWLQGTAIQQDITIPDIDTNDRDISVPTIEEEDCSCSNDDSSYGFSSARNVSDCCCSFIDMQQANSDTVHPLLQKIVQTPFFSHFKIDLCSSCGLWSDAPLCILKDCGVCECEEPPQWASEVPDCEHVDDQVVTTIADPLHVDWAIHDPIALSFLGTPSEEGGNSNINDAAAVVVDLKLNPERYTGYSGPSAQKVWSAIHNDNCFQSTGTDETCTLTPQQRVYNRILSGLHSSISLHIAHSYCLELNSERHWECQQWGANATLARERVLDHPDRLENLYVAFAMVLRAVQKAGLAVTAAVPTEDAFFEASLKEWTDSLLPQLVQLEQNCPMTFDESSLLDKSSDNDELQHRFRHLQQIMECVGCDRCKLWGTLQTLGIGTALRILQSANTPSLSRQEAVALVHTLERLSSSLIFAQELA